MSVVIGYSPSPQGEAALRAGLREARLLRVPVLVASHPYHHSDEGVTTASSGEVEEALTAAAAAGGEPIPDQVEILSGQGRDVGEFLLEVSQRPGVRLLVIGLRRKSPIGKLNLGASARRVVLSSPCPVLAVKDDPPVPREA